MTLQAQGNYDKAKALFDKYAIIPASMQKVLDRTYCHSSSVSSPLFKELAEGLVLPAFLHEGHLVMLRFLFQLGIALVAVRGQFPALDRRLHGAAWFPGVAAVGKAACAGEAADLSEAVV